MLEINDLNAWYGASHVLQGISLQVKKGELSASSGATARARARP